MLRKLANAMIIVAGLWNTYTSLAEQQKGAEQTEQQDLDLQLKEETIVVTGRKAKTPLKDSTPLVEVIDAQDVKQAGDKTAADTLNRHEGILVSPGIRGSEISIHGLSGKRILILVNGQRPTGRINDTYNVGLIPASMIDRIEIVKGANSVLYGSDAIGGIINIITKKPEHHDVTTKAQWEADSLNRHQLPTELTGGNQGHSIIVGGNYETGPTFDLDDLDLDTNGSAYQTKTARIQTSHQAKENLQIDSGISYQIAETAGIQTTGGGAIIDRTTKNKTGTFMLSPTYDLADGSSLKLNSSLSETKDNYREDQRGANQLDREQKARELVVETGIIFNKKISPKTDATVGVDYMEEESASDRLSNGERMRARISPFISLDWQTYFWDGLRINPGIRHDADSKFGNFTSKNLAIRLDVNSLWQLRLGYGEGYRAPSFRETFLFFENPSVGYQVLGNPNLRPETSKNMRSTITYSPTEAFKISTSASSSKVSDMINATNTASTSGSTATFTYENLLAVELKSISIQSKYETKNISASLDHTYLEAKSLSSGRLLAGRPKHLSKAEFSYNKPNWKTRFSIGINRTGKRPYYESLAMGGGLITVWEDHYYQGYSKLSKEFSQFEVFTGIRNITNENDKIYNSVPDRSYYIGLATEI